MTVVPQVPASEQSLVRELITSIILNAVIPVALYQLSKRELALSEFAALSVAALFPLVWSIAEIARSATVDPVGVVTLASIGVSMLAVLAGGNPKLLLIRESFFTGAFGVVCLTSLLRARPVMFYFTRHFTAGRDAGRIAAFDEGWQRPRFRRTIRRITVVWGLASLGEFAMRVALVYALPTSAVLVVSPLILGALLIGTITWTFAYGRRMRALADDAPASFTHGVSP